MDYPLTKAENRELASIEEEIDTDLKAFIRTGRNFMTIRDKRLHRDNHKSFDAYCRSRWNLGKSYANRLIAAAEAADDVSEVECQIGQEVVTIVPTSEAVAREMTGIDSIPQRADVWQRAVETAPTNSEGEPLVTAGHVAKTRKAMFPPEPSGNGEVADEPEVELWETFAEKHNEALNHLTAAMKAITWIEKHEADAAYLQPVITRIRTDYKALRGTISQNCPTGVKGGEIQTKVMERK